MTEPYSAIAPEGMDYAISEEQMRKLHRVAVAPPETPFDWEAWINASWGYRDSRFRAKVLGHFEYTPADELKHRLNQQLKGREPGLPINTRYWRELK